MNPAGRPPRSEYVSPREAAAMIRAALPSRSTISPRTVSRWFDAGILTGWRSPRGGHRRIRRASVEKYLKAELDTSDTGCNIHERSEEKGGAEHP